MRWGLRAAPSGHGLVLNDVVLEVHSLDRFAAVFQNQHGAVRTIGVHDVLHIIDGLVEGLPSDSAAALHQLVEPVEVLLIVAADEGQTFASDNITLEGQVSRVVIQLAGGRVDWRQVPLIVGLLEADVRIASDLGGDSS